MKTAKEIHVMSKYQGVKKIKVKETKPKNKIGFYGVINIVKTPPKMTDIKLIKHVK